MRIVTRAEIGIPGPTHTLTPRSDSLTGITWHWTGDGGTLYHPDPIQRLRGIYSYHVNTLGYWDIAYNGAIDQYGNLYQLRDNNVVGAHAAAANNLANRTTLGIVYLEDKTGLTSGAVMGMSACEKLYELAYQHHPQWFAHCYWGEHYPGPGVSPTSCPGVLKAYISFLGGNV